MARIRTLVAAVAAIATLALADADPSVDVKPAAVYDGGVEGVENAPIKLRLGNGGAGESGLIEALANAFIRDSVAENGNSGHFRVAWYKSDTTFTIKHLGQHLIDAGITYSAVAEDIAIDVGIAKAPAHYAFRDHFALVGPKDNPARLNGSASVTGLFSKLYEAAEAQPEGRAAQIRFLSRFDKSATNLKESHLWASVGQVPWADPVSGWYHKFQDYPLEALRAAVHLGEYTVTDRGTLLSLEAGLRAELAVIKAGGDDDPEDPLLNPARLLIARNATNAATADAFARWLVGERGQAVVEGFTSKTSGEKMYSRAPRS
ncbi:PBP superfamily protein [Hirsutella rhossiliensis]|uniref:PBP superfamily domain-containing protein n=1 Tax=Hirsutella rhossiliensis TaxID=111463 RepID=A0A9P8NC49_9HYPO|nr:PBP superfamily domain-containing protein [Hirsutella rhossiliensis]KAH0968442.1 PBP superfamily domain-containing protein [Hirsutella rhossiliensis]